MSATQPLDRVRDSETPANLFGILRRRWPVVLAVIVGVLAVAIVHQRKAAKSYASTASVAFQSGTLSTQALQVTTGSSEPQREANTEVLLAHSRAVAEAVRTQLHSAESAEELMGDVEVEAAPNANVLNIEAVTHSSAYSPKLANAFAQQYIAFRTRAQLSPIEAAATKLQQQLVALPPTSTERAALEQSIQKLNALRAVAGGGANVISPGGTAKLVGKSLTTTLLLALLIGLALAFAVVFLLETLDRRVKSLEEFERSYRLPVLSAIPQSGFRMRGAASRKEMLEPFRILRSALDFAAVTREIDTLMLTSAVSGEGKTTVAVDLSHTIALAGRRVVLVELDLRRPTFSDHFGLEPVEGLTTALTSDTSLSSLLVNPLPEVPNLSVLPAGPIPFNPSELLGSPAIAAIISELSENGTMVIVDAPPLNPVADAHVLLNNPAIRAAILVARLGHTTREEVSRARRILDHHHVVEPIGVVVTGVRDEGEYGYQSYRGEEPTLEADLDELSARTRRTPVNRNASRKARRRAPRQPH
ncbi:MAG: tyrosine-protein kinase domain-containing protein [Solirubrobacteraceae bacterium]